MKHQQGVMAMFLLCIVGQYHEYYHAAVYNGWTSYDKFRPGEGFWLVPGTDPEDDAYGRDYCADDEDENEGDENDETLEYMCDLCESGEIEAGEFRRQLRSVGYSDLTIAKAISLVAA